MNVAARGRYELARRPWLYRTLVAAVAVTCGLVVADATAAIDDARDSWGVTRTVIIASADIAPGEELAGRTSRAVRPVPALPEAALASVPAGAVARQRIAAGEALVPADVAATAGPRSLVPDGWSAVAVAEVVPSGTAVGDPVVAAAGGVVLAGEGLVVGHAGDAVLVAVPADDAPHVAHAAATGELTLLLVP
jgi:hypothetical protein